MEIAVALGLWWCVRTTVVAQDYSLPPRLTVEDRALAYGDEDGDKEWSCEFGPRFCLPRGSTGAGGDAGTWGDVFSSGSGFRIEVAYEHHINATWRMGAYASIAQIFLHGRSFTDPVSGTDVAVDDARILPLLLGPQGSAHFGSGFFADARTGIGVVNHRPADADTVGGSRSFIDHSVTFSWEIGAHVGWKIPNEKKATFGFFAGMGYQIWGAPEFNQEVFPGFDGKWVQNTTFDFGFWIGY